ncbi:MAG TPA: hypothetical protein VFW33_11520 [Gemmataceae bacterium]|nr:hypothetical protein [Gemmataceae bacterium]
MSKKLEAARRNAARRAATASKRAEAVKLAEQRAAERVAKAEQAVREAEERLRKVKEQAAAIIAKRQQQATAAAERAGEAAERVKLAESKPAKPAKPAAIVTTETGQSYGVGKAAADAVKAATGRKRTGTLPADSEAAQSLLTALDNATGNLTGDSFAVSITNRKTQLIFTVTAEGLAFRTASPVVGVAAIAA